MRCTHQHHLCLSLWWCWCFGWSEGWWCGRSPTPAPSHWRSSWQWRFHPLRPSRGSVCIHAGPHIHHRSCFDPTMTRWIQGILHALCRSQCLLCQWSGLYLCRKLWQRWTLFTHHRHSEHISTNTSCQKQEHQSQSYMKSLRETYSIWT